MAEAEDEMSDRKSYDDAFGDAVYDAWRSGLNPDHVDRERTDQDVRDCYSRDEAAEREVDRLRRTR